MAPREADLGAAELEVLKTLWEGGPSTVRDVMNHLAQRGRRLAYTTVMTVLGRLEQKGFVASDRSGQAYVYRAAVTRRRVTRSRAKSLIEQLYDGAAAPLVLQLMREEKFSPDEIAELQNLIEQLDPRHRATRSGRSGRSGGAGR